MIRRGLIRCPDEAAILRHDQLLFIKEEHFRVALERDFSAANSALKNGEWKAATVLAGSVLEALLLWAVEKEDPVKVEGARQVAVQRRRLRSKPNNDLLRWDLLEYIEVAVVLNLIEEKTAVHQRLVKDFRNLIHPGRAMRLQQECKRGTALAALAAVELLLEDFGKKFEG